MGLDLDFVTKNDSDEHEPIPDYFTDRYKFRHAFLSALNECETVHFRTCDCPAEEKHVYMCDAIEPSRPQDFAEFRRKLENKGIFEGLCREMFEFLERNSNVFVTFDY